MKMSVLYEQIFKVIPVGARTFENLKPEDRFNHLEEVFKSSSNLPAPTGIT